MNRLVNTVICLIALSASFGAVSSDEDEQVQRVSEGSFVQIYSPSLHEEMSIINRYVEGGTYYLRGEINSFGEREVVNTQQEVIFCGSNDLTFTEVAKLSLSRVQFADHDGLVIKDSASTGALPSQFIADLELSLIHI